MANAILAKLVGNESAEAIAAAMEYEWHRGASWGRFAKI
jgi:hypothetical protein